MGSSKQKIGLDAQNKALSFLEKKGLKFLTKNYECEFGEIDLILKDKDYVVFVEVRSRQPNDYASASESITPSKQSKIIKTATYYLIEKNWLNKINCRFDIVTIEDNQLDWIPNAFDVISPAL